MAEKTFRSEAVYRTAEENANAFNLKCLAVLCALTVIASILNALGVFTVPGSVLFPTMIVSFVFFAIPIFIFLIREKLFKPKEPILQNPRFKYIILSFCFLGIALLSVMLSHQAIILLAVLPLIAAQYRESKSVTVFMIISTLVLVPVGVYGGFFFGTLDRNLLKGLQTDSEAAVFANRLALATPKRMLDLFTHYAIPRLFSVTAVILLTTGITKRNKKMVEDEASLTEKVRRESERINTMQSRVIDALATLIETRDEGTGEHVARTKLYVKMIADEMRKDPAYREVLTDAAIATIYNAAPLHDVGKIAISDTILLKPGKLTDEEFEIMKTHTTKGGKMIRTAFAGLNDDELLKVAEEIAISHHEKWDGSGYPKGLKGEEIPLSARIMAVADVYDALTSVRVYKKAVTPEKALEIMASESGTHFDPSIMRIVEKLRGKLIETALQGSGN